MDPADKRKLLDDNRQKERERKARTRNLIQMGGVAASFGFEKPEDLETLFVSLVNSEEGRELLQARGAKPSSRWPEEGELLL